MADETYEKKSLEEISRAYDSPPWWYDVRGFFILTFAYRSSLGFQLRLFGPNIGARHLEVAIGSGSLLDIILRWRNWKGYAPSQQIVGIDYAMPMLAGAIHRFRGRADIELHHADVAALPFPEASFDSANVANAIHCFPQVDDALCDIFRVLKPGGTMAVNVLLYPVGPQPWRSIAQRINDWGMRKGILTTPYEPGDIRGRIIGVGFEILSEVQAGNTYCAVARKPMAPHKFNG